MRPPSPTSPRPSWRAACTRACAPLRDRLDRYRNAADGPVRAEHARTIRRLAVDMDLHVDLDLDPEKAWSDDDFFRLSNHVETIDGAKVVQGFYTLGKAFSDGEIHGTAELMAIDPIAYGLAGIDIAKGVVESDVPRRRRALRAPLPAARAARLRAAGGRRERRGGAGGPRHSGRPRAGPRGIEAHCAASRAEGRRRRRRPAPEGPARQLRPRARERGAGPRRGLRRALARGRPHRQSRRRPHRAQPLLHRRRADAVPGGVDGGAQAGRVADRRTPAAARRVAPEGRLHPLADRLHRHRGRHHRPGLLPPRGRAGLGPARAGRRPATDPLGRPRPAPHRRRRPDRRPAPRPRRLAPRPHQPRRRHGGRGARRRGPRQLRPRGPAARRGGDDGQGPLPRRRAALLDPARLRAA